MRPVPQADQYRHSSIKIQVRHQVRYQTPHKVLLLRSNALFLLICGDLRRNVSDPNQHVHYSGDRCQGTH